LARHFDILVVMEDKGAGGQASGMTETALTEMCLCNRDFSILYADKYGWCDDLNKYPRYRKPVKAM